MQGGFHDNNGSAQTMWHTTQRPAPTSATAGLPASPAWVRFDFAQPQTIDSIHIWNHNQANLTDRGFRRRAFRIARWHSVVRADIAGCHRIATREWQPGRRSCRYRERREDSRLESGCNRCRGQGRNYGGDYYFGLSAVRFGVGHEVAEADLPLPTSMACAALPYSPTDPMASRAAKWPYRSEREALWRGDVRGRVCRREGADDGAREYAEGSIFRCSCPSEARSRMNAKRSLSCIRGARAEQR